MAGGLLEYIKSCQAKGMSKDNIETNLLATDWTKEQIDQAFQQLTFQSGEDGSSQEEPDELKSSKNFGIFFGIAFFVLCLIIAVTIIYFLVLQKPE